MYISGQFIHIFIHLLVKFLKRTFMSSTLSVYLDRVVPAHTGYQDVDPIHIHVHMLSVSVNGQFLCRILEDQTHGMETSRST